MIGGGFWPQIRAFVWHAKANHCRDLADLESGRDSSFPCCRPISDLHVAARLKPDGPVSPEAIIAALQEQNAALLALVAALQAVSLNWSVKSV